MGGGPRPRPPPTACNLRRRGVYGLFSGRDNANFAAVILGVARPWEPEKVVAAPAPTVTGQATYTHAGQAFSGTVATVAGSSAGSLSAVINWGDLSRSPATVTPTADGYAISETHVYTTPGAYRQTVTVVDPDPVNSRLVNGFAFVDTSPYPYLTGLVGTYSTSSGVTAGLNAKVEAAARAPNETARANALDAFVNQVRAQTGKAVTAGQADDLTRLAESLK